MTIEKPLATIHEGQARAPHLNYPSLVVVLPEGFVTVYLSKTQTQLSFVKNGREYSHIWNKRYVKYGLIPKAKSLIQSVPKD